MEGELTSYSEGVLLQLLLVLDSRKVAPRRTVIKKFDGEVVRK